MISGSDLAEKGVGNVDALQFATPSVVVNNFGQGNDFNIRGIGKAEHNTQTTTGVITYRDGVPTFPGYFQLRALLRRRQHPGAARPAGHDRRPERDRRRGVRQHRTIRSSAAGSTATSRPITAITTTSAPRARSTCRSATPSPRASLSTASGATASTTSPAPAARPIPATTAICASPPAGSACSGSRPTGSRSCRRPIWIISTRAPIRPSPFRNFYRFFPIGSGTPNPTYSRPVRHHRQLAAGGARQVHPLDPQDRISARQRPQVPLGQRLPEGQYQLPRRSRRHRNRASTPSSTASTSGRSRRSSTSSRPTTSASPGCSAPSRCGTNIISSSRSSSSSALRRASWPASTQLQGTNPTRSLAAFGQLGFLITPQPQAGRRRPLHREPLDQPCRHHPVRRCRSSPSRPPSRTISPTRSRSAGRWTRTTSSTPSSRPASAPAGSTCP